MPTANRSLDVCPASEPSQGQEKKTRRPSKRRISHWQKLRAWQNRPNPIRPSACHSVSRLLAEQERGRDVKIPAALLRRTKRDSHGHQVLDPESKEPILVPFLGVGPLLAAYVALACLERGHQALLGTGPQVDRLLGCSERTRQRALLLLEREQLVTRVERYEHIPGFVARDGRRLENPQACNAYVPGPMLRVLWRAWQTEKRTVARRAAAERVRAKNHVRRLRKIQDRQIGAPSELESNSVEKRADQKRGRRRPVDSPISVPGRRPLRTFAELWWGPDIAPAPPEPGREVPRLVISGDGEMRAYAERLGGGAELAYAVRKARAREDKQKAAAEARWNATRDRPAPPPPIDERGAALAMAHAVLEVSAECPAVREACALVHEVRSTPAIQKGRARELLREAASWLSAPAQEDEQLARVQVLIENLALLWESWR